MAKRFAFCWFVLIFFYTHLFASLHATGTKLISIPLNKSHAAHLKQKQIGVINYVLTDSQKAAFAARLLHIPRAGRADLPKKVNLRMNHVPVLDQGKHGTCVTFASTGAIDAALGMTDGISQLCNLTLGNYLELYTNQPSGWSGTTGEIVLNQLTHYGFITKDKQHSTGCGGLTEYPKQDPNEHGGLTSIEEFISQHEVLPPTFLWTQLLAPPDPQLQAPFDPDELLDEVKASLSEGHRLTIGVLLDTRLGRGGALGNYKKEGDAWIMTDEIREDVKMGRIHSGHHLIVQGYNDNVKLNGDKSKGMLYIRNSWGDHVGNDGEYYMSYDYFRIMVHEANKIIGPSDKGA